MSIQEAASAAVVEADIWAAHDEVQRALIQLPRELCHTATAALDNLMRLASVTAADAASEEVQS